MPRAYRPFKVELRILASDFGLFHRPEVKQIINNCKTYNEGQRKILDVYEKVYMR